MAYSHGRKWSEAEIENEIKRVIETAKIDTFPTHSLIKEITGNCALTNAISKHGGSKYWAERMGLEIAPCESKLGGEFELYCADILRHMYGFDCKLTPPRYPYDVLVNDSIKIDVKCGNLVKGETGEYYTFRLGKEMPTCDIFVCFCVNKDIAEKVYIIPSCAVSGLVQLSIGKNESKYNQYLAMWVIVRQYNEFYKNMKRGCDPWKN